MFQSAIERSVTIVHDCAFWCVIDQIVKCLKWRRVGGVSTSVLYSDNSPFLTGWESAPEERPAHHC